jgi:hypothetical protein
MMSARQNNVCFVKVICIRNGCLEPFFYRTVMPNLGTEKQEHRGPARF